MEAEFQLPTDGGDMFTKTLHSEVYPDIDPTKGQFSEPLVVVVIGASRGIGEHIAKAYASAKASTIVLAARSADRLKEVEGEIRNTDSSVDIRRYPCDVTSTDSVAALAASIEKDIGRLDVVVYNSGFAGPCYDKLHEIDPKDFQDAFAINPVGTYLAGHYLIPLLLKSPNGAKTFLTVSTTGCWVREGPLMNTQYFTSKLAQERITELIGTQYREDGLFAAALHPGGVVTKMAQDSMPKQFMGFLTDSVELCGAFSVWLTKNRKEIGWLSGRYISTKWDVKELLAKKDEVVDGNLLVASVRLNKLVV